MHIRKYSWSICRCTVASSAFMAYKSQRSSQKRQNSIYHCFLIWVSMQSLKPEAVKVHSLFSKCPSPNSFNPVVGLSCFFFFPFPNVEKAGGQNSTFMGGCKQKVKYVLNMFHGVLVLMLKCYQLSLSLSTQNWQSAGKAWEASQRCCCFVFCFF